MLAAYVVGEAGLTTALHDVGYTMTERSPDYVVLGETGHRAGTARLRSPVSTAFRAGP